MKKGSILALRDLPRRSAVGVDQATVDPTNTGVSQTNTAPTVERTTTTTILKMGVVFRRHDGGRRHSRTGVDLDDLFPIHRTKSTRHVDGTRIAFDIAEEHVNPKAAVPIGKVESLEEATIKQRLTPRSDLSLVETDFNDSSTAGAPTALNIALITIGIVKDEEQTIQSFDTSLHHSDGAALVAFSTVSVLRLEVAGVGTVEAEIVDDVNTTATAAVGDELHRTGHRNFLSIGRSVRQGVGDGNDGHEAENSHGEDNHFADDLEELFKVNTGHNPPF
ncbi:hypothetical protein KGP36_03055 [Patescibacteria group bacterium]|nr:hypothetical protein [Patescibacteria group bacterium]